MEDIASLPPLPAGMTAEAGRRFAVNLNHRQLELADLERRLRNAESWIEELTLRLESRGSPEKQSAHAPTGGAGHGDRRSLAMRREAR